METADVRGNRFTETFLVEADGFDCSTLEKYDPLGVTPPLFLQFAGLDCTTAGIVAFANEFGNLGINEPDGWGFRLHDQSNNSERSRGEPIGEWRYGVYMANAVLDVLDCLDIMTGREKRVGWTKPERETEKRKRAAELKSQAKQKLSRLLFEDLRVVAASSRQMFTRPDKPGSPRPQWEKSDLIAPAHYFVKECIGCQLLDQIRIQLYTGDDGRLMPYHCPRNLHAAIWLQIYWRAIGKTRIRRCTAPDCNGWLDATDKRSDKTMHDTCSHRLRMSRWREKEAMRLAKSESESRGKRKEGGEGGKTRKR